jgi:hypothetical protein
VRTISASSSRCCFIAGTNQIEIQRIQRTGRGTNGHAGDMQIACRGLQMGVAQQDLDGAKFDAGFEQVRGEGVPRRVRMNGLGDARNPDSFRMRRDPGPTTSGP